MFYLFARTMQHDEKLTDAVVRALEAQHMQTITHSIYLLKTWPPAVAASEPGVE